MALEYIAYGIGLLSVIGAALWAGRQFMCPRSEKELDELANNFFNIVIIDKLKTLLDENDKITIDKLQSTKSALDLYFNLKYNREELIDTTRLIFYLFMVAIVLVIVIAVYPWDNNTTFGVIMVGLFFVVSIYKFIAIFKDINKNIQEMQEQVSISSR